LPCIGGGCKRLALARLVWQCCAGSQGGRYGARWPYSCALAGPSDQQEDPCAAHDDCLIAEDASASQKTRGSAPHQTSAAARFTLPPRSRPADNTETARSDRADAKGQRGTQLRLRLQRCGEEPARPYRWDSATERLLSMTLIYLDLPARLPPLMTGKQSDGGSPPVRTPTPRPLPSSAKPGIPDLRPSDDLGCAPPKRRAGPA